MNKNYEVMFIVKIMEEEAIEAMVTRVEDLITRNDGTIKNIERMGRRRLAYEIQKMNEGYYVLIDFEIDPVQIQEIDRVIKINEDIIRHLIVKQDE